MKQLNMRIIFGCLLYIALSLLARNCEAQAGALQSFGINNSGQIGDGTYVGRQLPTPALSISGIKAVSCGAFHTLALDSGGMVWAWGLNNYGQLGTGDYKGRTAPVQVLGGIKAIAAGNYFSLALDYTGHVWVWGDNYQGQLGMGDLINRPTPTQMTDPLNHDIKFIAAGGYHSLLINQYGALFGCGENAYGQLGQPDFQNHPQLTFITYGAIQAAGGSLHTLVLTSNHDVYSSGMNSSGQLGDGTTTAGRHDFYFQYNPIANAVRSIATGGNHNLAIGLNGRVVSWGFNDSGQLGLGYAGGHVSTPTEIPGVNNAKEVAAGGFHSLVLTADGKVLATGRNLEGQLGDGTTMSRASFAPVSNAEFISVIAVGFQHSAILQAETQVMAAGSNVYGQLGNGTTAEALKPVPMVGADHIIAVASGSPYGYHSLLLRADGTVWACGSNQWGQLGNGAMTLTPNPTPVQVRGPKGAGFLSNIIAIAAGNGHSLALAADGTVYAWGLNNNGQLGIGNRTNSAFPVQIPMLKDGNYNVNAYVYAIAAGAAHSLLLRNDGQLYGTGWNQYGQLGLSDLNGYVSFTKCDGQNHQIAIAAGYTHSLSLKYTGEIFAWGNNQNGQLALGDTRSRYIPTLQPGTAAIAIACGGYHSLCINGSGQLFVAGMNRYGQLGLGDTNDRTTWSYGGYLGMSEIAAGDVHSLIANPFGTLLTAGDGAYGALGLGTTDNKTSFIPLFDVPNVIGMAGGITHSLILTAPPVSLVSISVSPTSVKGSVTATGTVTLNGVAGPGGQRVYLSSYSLNTSGQYVNAATLPAYVDVPATSNATVFPITTQPVSVKTVTTINGGLNRSATTTLTILP